MAALATTQDFEARHGVLGVDDTALVEALLDDASAFIRDEAAGADADWVAHDAADDVAVPATVKAICIQVAYRAWANPDSVAREQLGEMSRTYRGDDQSDAMWLTANERRMIRKAANRETVRSIPVETPYSGGSTDTHPMDFYPDGLGGEGS